MYREYPIQVVVVFKDFLFAPSPEVDHWVVATQIFLEFSPGKLAKMNPF